MRKKIIGLKPFNNKVFYKDAIFNERSQAGSPWLIATARFLAKKNIIMNTIDLSPENTTQKDVYMDVPYPWEIKIWFRILKNIQKNILFLIEPPIVNPFNYMQMFHMLFSKIYTWNDKYVDNIKYFKFFFPKKSVGTETKKIPFRDKKLLILMNSNLAPFLPFRLLSLPVKQLYTKRIEAIEFFEKYYPSDFSLYGRGWNKPQKFSIKQRLFGYKKYKTYRGEFPQEDKYKILSQFRFCLCFENSVNSGYIEKLIDYLKGRLVPVYWGAPNITDYISSKCFIDFRKFKNFDELIKFLKKMDEKTYNNYLTEIEKLISSKEFLKRWSIEAFPKTFLKAIT